MSDYKAIVKLLKQNTGARRLSNVFDDFVEMFALAIRNAVDRHGWDEREERYLRISGQYTRDQLNRFAEAFAMVTNTMGDEPRDVLGKLYMELELGNEAMGQFYTPYDLARLLADMQADALTGQVESRGFAEIYEPACGAGAFMVAASEAFRAKGFNPQTQLHVTAEDLSAQAVHMIYIHMTLLGIPAVIHRRNTLSMETFDTWYTPAHILGGWSWRLRSADAAESALDMLNTLPVVEQIEMTEASPWDAVFEGISS